MTLCFALLFLFASIHAGEPVDSASVSSASADYNGSTLVLRGNVSLDHGLGKMTAEEAELEKQEAGKDFPFSLIHLKKAVVLSLKDRGELQCFQADLDFQAMKGNLLAGPESQVRYVDNGLVSLMSQTAELIFAKKESEGKKTVFDVETLTAKENVVIEYGHGYALFADQAIYYKHPSEETQKKNTGLVVAYPECRLVHEGDVIHAGKGELYVEEKKFTLLQPRGTLTSSLIPQGGKTVFTSDDLVWDHQKNQLQLRGHIHVAEDSLGILDADEELILSHAMQKGKKILSSIKTKGLTTLQLHSEKTKGPRLISQGTIVVDRKHLHALLESPRIKGVVPQDKQLYFEEERLAGNADQAVIDFSISGKILEPQSIVLRGNVRLYSDHSCGLADRISFSPSTRTVFLMANPGKKVLFWDESQNLRLSAPEIHLTIDPVTQKDVVKGVGNVQFAFSAEESDKIKKMFPSYKETQ